MTKLRTNGLALVPKMVLMALLGGFFSAAGADTLQMDGTMASTDDGRPSGV